MNNTIYISVVLSTFNEERYISESIQSILNQSYPYFEFIIVNDGSTDNTLNIIKSFNDPRIIVIDKPNSGLPDSLNIGIENAKYDWIARMDGDDIAEPTRFETQVKYINKTVGVIGGQYISIDENGNELTGNISAKPLSYHTCKRWLLLGMSPIAHPTVLIRKSCLKKYGGYDTNFKAAQDIELWSRLSPNVEIINVPEKVLKYRHHSNNITNKKKELQRKLTFLGFMKYILRIRKPLTKTEFSQFENFFSNNGLIQRNDKYFTLSHKGVGVIRSIKLVSYYMWRLMLVLKYRYCRSSIIKKIFTCNTNL